MKKNINELRFKFSTNLNTHSFVESFNNLRNELKITSKEITQELKKRKMIDSNKGRIYFKFKKLDHGSIVAIFISVVVGIISGVAANAIYDLIKHKTKDKHSDKDGVSSIE